MSVEGSEEAADVVDLHLGLVGSAIRNRKILKRWIQDAANKRTPWGYPSEVLVVGRPGSGKSHLLAFLKGSTLNANSKLPTVSRGVERETISTDNDVRNFAAVPGQTGRPQSRAYKDAFASGFWLDLVIHVVDFGFTKSQAELNDEMAIERGVTTIEQRRQENRDAELVVFRETLSRCRDFLNNNKSRQLGLLIAINKCDLFWDNRYDASMYYSVEGKSPFSAACQEFLASVGSDNLVIDSALISSYQKHYVWNGLTSPCAPIETDDARQMQSGFLSKIDDILVRTRR